ncbi:MAG: hypothetical protein K2P15_05625 [Oscillospiraceae bacterium]|jgi:hypothetical protein|nr:hypothetical protein [Oscillospiraceae bacterium]MDE6900540.1 hypothetical protein [Oscillospiraceae bacterium]
MKKILAIYKAYMVRPILYQCVTRCAVALAAVLVWDRFVPSSLLAVRDGCLAAAVILLMMAWFVYLKLDGMMVHHLLEDRRKKKKKSKRRVGGDIADYVDEHIVSFDELEEGEQTACRLAADLLAAALFLAASLIAMAL